MKTIPHQRKVFYLIVITLLPLCICTTHYFSEKNRYETLIARLSDDTELALMKRHKEAPNREVRRMFQKKDPFYTNKRLEPILTLEDEIASLQKLSQVSYHPEEDALRRRLDFLASGKNTLSFSEISVKKYPGFTETYEMLNRAVEVDAKDFLKIISKIEGTALCEAADEDRPQMLISECKLERRKELLQEIYTMHLKIIKREYF